MKNHKSLIYTLVLYLLIFTGCTNQPPVCSIISPANGDEFTQSDIVTFVINATDEDGSIERIEIMAGTELITTLTQMPFIYEWDTKEVEPGSYTVTATAVDDEGEAATSIVPITIRV
jgi:chitinase